MTKTLQQALNRIDDQVASEFLGATFPRIALAKFSRSKSLFGFQQQALRNAVKGLQLFYEQSNGDKREFFYNVYRKEQLELKGYLPNKHLNNYKKDFIKSDNEKEIPFSQFCNRMSFWMATGSGKTLVIVKLIEILAAAMRAGKIPQRDILFLAHRPNLLRQFKELVNEFNKLSKVKILLHDLRDFDEFKHRNSSLFNGAVNIFYYRSDLISDEQKETIVNFKHYDNKGEWYILLDEAHKGSGKEISKRQTLYSIMSRKGFMFNFSATFTEENDNATCAYNFNLDKFIADGYGKQIYVSSRDADGFKKESDFSHLDKQKIVMKTLILHAYVAEHMGKIKQQAKQNLYHRPLLMCLVNSVNTAKDMEQGKQPDLQVLFQQLDKIANNKLEKGIFEEARQELVNEMKGAEYAIGDGKIQMDISYLTKISYEEVLLRVFNAEKPGNIEALRIPGNKQEVALKLQTAEQPFALIKIGDVITWINNVLLGHKEVGRTWSGASIFDKLNAPASNINILMGSRAFYEGWDSNRPNIILFVNIGVGAESKKFVLQSIGRGVRIEPVADGRRRASELLAEGKIKPALYEKIKNYKDTAETLFVFGTKAENLQKIMEYVRQEKQTRYATRSLGDLFAVASDAVSKNLHIPQYKNSEKLLVEDKQIVRHPISAEDLKLTEDLLTAMPDEVAIMMYECSPKVVEKVKNTFADKSKYYTTEHDARTLGRPLVTIERVLGYFGSVSKELDGFKFLEDEIRHYKKISFTGSDAKYQELRAKIGVMTDKTKKQAELEKARKDPNTSIEELSKQMAHFNDAESFEAAEGVNFDLHHLANHYYNPVLTSQSEKQEYLHNIIQVKSEVEFLKKLSAKVDELDESFEWWMFSKINEQWDKVSIPYHNSSTRSMGKYHPDFIFWLKEKHADNLHILFVDPKGTQHSDYQHKADYHSHFFGKPGRETQLKKDETNIKVYLRFFANGTAKVGENYRDYWLDDVKAIAKLGKSPAKKQAD